MATMRFLRLSTLPHFKWRCPEKNSLCNNNHSGFIKLLPRRISAKNVNVSTADIPEILALNSNLRSHKNIHDFSLTHPEHFWGTLAKSRLQWIKEFDQVMDCDLKIGKIAWFIGGQLNVTVNCVDRHAKNTPDKIALIWEKDEPGQEEKITYKELYEKVNQFANTLKNHGVKRGDRVAIYLPVTPIAVIAMLACARIGAIHSVVFAGFSAESLAARIQDAKAETVITADESVRGGKKIQLKKVVDVAVAKCPFVKRIFVSKLLGSDVTMTKLDIPLEQVLDKESKECPPEVMESEDLLFLLYTSGSTGKPKGIAHSQAGYLLYTALTHKLVFNYEEGDVFGCVADIGWITGHSYVVYGPLCNGGTSVLFESIPTYPDPGRYWETVQRLKINQFYGAPTAIRLLLKYGDDWVTKYDRSSLKTIGSVGEPINYDAWKWYYNVVGESRCPLVDTWWQTETGGITIAPQPSDPNAEIKPGMAMRPFFGIDLVLINEQGKEILTNNVTGALCIRQAWPGIARTVYQHHERFIQTYFSQYSGYYFSGDGAIRDSDGHYQITGRIDDVINVSGHRLGTAEVEYVLGNHPAVAESAVVGYPHEIKGEGIYAYVVLKDRISDSMENIIKELKMKVKSQIASYAVPDFILICNGLPKTRSGKIMRRILRKISANKPDELEDTSSLSDPLVVEILVKDHENLMKKIE